MKMQDKTLEDALFIDKEIQETIARDLDCLYERAVFMEDASEGETAVADAIYEILSSLDFKNIKDNAIRFFKINVFSKWAVVFYSKHELFKNILRVKYKSNDILITYKDSECALEHPECSIFCTFMNYLFYKLEIHELDMSLYDTRNCFCMTSMFESATIKTLKLNMDTSKVKYMASMFKDCVTDVIDVSYFDTRNVITMESMFASSRAKLVGINKLDTSKCKSLGFMFNYITLKSLDLYNFDFSNAEQLDYMFANSHIAELNCHCKGGATNVYSTRGMFLHFKGQVKNLESLDLRSVKHFEEMFRHSSIDEIDLSFISCDDMQNVSKMFQYCLANTVKLGYFIIDGLDSLHKKDMFLGYTGNVVCDCKTEEFETLLREGRGRGDDSKRDSDSRFSYI